MSCCASLSSLFFFNDTATTEIYTLSLHDALPISLYNVLDDLSIKNTINNALLDEALLLDINTDVYQGMVMLTGSVRDAATRQKDRKSTRLNSSHSQISYAVFCLKKKKRHEKQPRT